MKPLRSCLCLFVMLALPLAALAQPKRDAIVIYKDGFHIKGVVNESVKEVIYDRTSGRPFPIFSGQFFLHDHVRDVLFSPGQISKVIQPTILKPPMYIVRFDTFRAKREIHPTWEFSNYGKWDEKGERTIDFRTVKGLGQMTQRVATVSPNYIQAVTTDYNWNLNYFTHEFGPELTRKIIFQIMSEKKAFKDLTLAEKRLQVAGFLHEAGWFLEAEKELASIVESFPEEKKTAEELLAKVKKDRAELFVENLEQAEKVGQHATALSSLEIFDAQNFAKIVSPEHQRRARDLRTKYDKLKTDMEEMRSFLRTMPLYAKQPKVWTKAMEFITEELNHDTANRLEEFLLSAQQYELERKNKREHSQSAEKVLATAITGWLQGSQAALPDPDAALKMAKAREFLLEYLKADSQLKRTNLLSDFKRSNDLSIDVMARLVRMIPPPAPHDKINTEMQTLTIEAPEAEAGTYHLQLPPDYHPLRSYPVLIVLASGRDKSDDTHQRFSEEAGKAGFILATVQWAPNKVVGRSKYGHTKREHDLVTDTLRDLRRRFQVDSDRVFLFGWEDGANMALDVGLGHPDLFAGVAPMNGSLCAFARRFYWPNAQYLPLYLVGGERDGHAAQTRDLLKKEWTRDPYGVTYVEYKGRSSEWFGLEVAKALAWMKNKKRYYPIKEMGRPSNGTALGEEFRSSRHYENRFYWLRCETLAAATLHDHTGKAPLVGYKPATFQANISLGNKSKGKDEALIWNQLNVRVSGMKNVSFWIQHGTMDLKHPLAINLNSAQLGGMRKVTPSLDTMLEELAQTGDRQRLYVAKVDLR